MPLSTDNSRSLDESRRIVTDSLREIRKSAASIADVMQTEVLHNSKVLRTVATMLEDGLVLLDKDSRITIFNPAASSIFGVNANEAVGKTFEQLFPGLARRLQESSDTIQDLHTLDDRGHQGLVNLSFTRLTEPDEGTPFSVLVASKEKPSADKERQAALDNLYQLAVWHLPVPAVFTDLSGHIISGSQDFYTLMGRTPQQLTGRAIEEVMPADAVPWYYNREERSTLQMHLSTPQGIQEFIGHKTLVRSHDDMSIHGYITVLIRQQSTDTPEIGFVSTFIKTIDALNTPIMLVSFSEGRILLVNKAFGSKYHYERQEIINKSATELAIDGTFKRVSREVVVKLTRGEETIQRVRIKDALGNRVWLTFKAIAIQTEGSAGRYPKYCLLTEV